MAKISKKKVIVPGDALDILMAANGLDEKSLGKAISESPSTIKNIIDGKKDMSISIAVKLATILKTSKDFWINVQLEYELSKGKVVQVKPAARGRKPSRGRKASNEPSLFGEAEEDKKPQGKTKAGGSGRPRGRKPAKKETEDPVIPAVPEEKTEN